MLKTMVVGVETSINGFGEVSPFVGLVLRGISREEIHKMLNRYAVVIVRKK